MPITLTITAADGATTTISLPEPTVNPSFNDGSANAPANAPLFPTLLSGYPVRPSWKVPGIDYGVGITPDTVLKNPMTDPLFKNTAKWQIVSTREIDDNTTGGNNGVVIDGYDFSVNGGIKLYIDSNNVVISNCNFVCTVLPPGGGGADPTDWGDGHWIRVDGNNVTFRNCVFNLNGWDASEIMEIDGVGATIEYCYFANGYGHMLQCGGHGNLVIKYNVFHNNGNDNAHTNFIQLGDDGSAFNYTVTNNLTYQQSVTARPAVPRGVVGNNAGTEGFQLTNASGSGSSVKFSGANSYDHNVHISLANAQDGWLIGVDAKHLQTGATIDCEHNYVDPTGLIANPGDITDPSFFAPGLTYRNNINLVTGAALPNAYP